MKHARLLFFFSALFVILALAFILIKTGQGYRADFSTRTIRPTGLLVATSIPDGAQLWIDGELKSATNTTLNLSPGEYAVEIKKDGFTPWKKKLKIEKELVTKTDAYLFSTFPNLKALTFTGASSPLISPDKQKVLFAVSGSSTNKNGLWILDLADSPLGLFREPRQIIVVSTKGRDFSKAKFLWSPDSKQILVTFRNKLIEENFLLDSDRLNFETALIDMTASLNSIKRRWQAEETLREQAKLRKLPSKLQEAIDQKIKDIEFSPDETKILYTATASASIPKNILPPIIGSNSQKESREIKSRGIYVYDLREDKNFYITQEPESEKVKKQEETKKSFTISWFPTSKHIFIVQKDKISIVEYDGTNLVDVYSGPFEDFFAASFPAGNRFLVLTSIGKDAPVNLYAISLR